MFEDLFRDILEEDEKIIRIEHADVKSARKKNAYKIFLILFSVAVETVFLFYFFSNPLLDDLYYYILIGILIMFGIAIIVIPISIVFSIKNCKNYYMCLTNKRIIIRDGLFKVSFESYSISNVTGKIETSYTNDEKSGEDSSVYIDIYIERLYEDDNEELNISSLYPMENGYDFIKEIEKVVKKNSDSSVDLDFDNEEEDNVFEEEFDDTDNFHDTFTTENANSFVDSFVNESYEKNNKTEILEEKESSEDNDFIDFYENNEDEEKESTESNEFIEFSDNKSDKEDDSFDINLDENVEEDNSFDDDFGGDFDNDDEEDEEEEEEEISFKDMINDMIEKN